MFLHPQYRDEAAIGEARKVLHATADKYGLHSFSALEQVGGFFRIADHPWEFALKHPCSEVLDDLLSRGLGENLRVRLDVPGGMRAEAPFRGPRLKDVLQRWLDREAAEATIVRWGPDHLEDPPWLLIRSNREDDRLQLQLWEYASESWTSIRYGHIYLNASGRVVHADPGDIEWQGSQRELREAFIKGRIGKGRKLKLWRIDPPESAEVSLETVIGWIARSFRSSGEVLASELFWPGNG